MTRIGKAINMKALCKLSDGVTIEVEGEKLDELLEALTEVRDAIGPEPCGKCKGTNTFPHAKTVDENTFYELKCGNYKCQAVLKLGKQKATGRLYKKRYEIDAKGKSLKDEDGKTKYLPNNGWQIYNHKTGKTE